MRASLSPFPQIFLNVSLFIIDHPISAGNIKGSVEDFMWEYYVEPKTQYSFNCFKLPVSDASFIKR